jgi:hypothetical protein
VKKDDQSNRKAKPRRTKMSLATLLLAFAPALAARFQPPEKPDRELAELKAELEAAKLILAAVRTQRDALRQGKELAAMRAERDALRDELERFSRQQALAGLQQGLYQQAPAQNGNIIRGWAGSG